MRKETINLREKWIQEKWQKHRNILSMQDLAEIFGISVGNVYRILKKVDQRKLEKSKNN